MIRKHLVAVLAAGAAAGLGVALGVSLAGSSATSTRTVTVASTTTRAARTVTHVRTLEPGMRVALADGSTVEIVSNPKDGIWVFGRYLSSPGDPSRIGTEEMVFAQDMVEIQPAP